MSVCFCAALVHVRKYVCLCARACARVCVHVHVHVRARVCMCMCMCARVCACACACACYHPLTSTLALYGYDVADLRACTATVILLAVSFRIFAFIAVVRKEVKFLCSLKNNVDNLHCVFH